VLAERSVWKAQNRMRGLWARGQTDQFFLHVRVGIGRWKSDTAFQAPSGLTDDESKDLHRRIDDHRFINHAPVSIDLQQSHCALVGRSSSTLQVMNLVISELAVNHSPADVRLFVLLPKAGRDFDAFADWLKWLPHLRSEAGILPSYRIYRGKEQ